MADMKREFQKLGAEGFDAFAQFISFFTVKRVITLLIVALAIVAVCSPHDVPISGPEACDASCPLPEAAAPPAEPPIHTELLNQENWSFTLVGDGWTDRDPSSDGIKIARENRNLMCMVFVVKEETTDSLGAYVISTIRAFSESGATIDAVKIVMLNGQKFVLTQVDKDDEVIWAWVTVKNGVGYGFTCGCEINVDAGRAQYLLCQTMADSFQIK